MARIVLELKSYCNYANKQYCETHYQLNGEAAGINIVIKILKGFTIFNFTYDNTFLKTYSTMASFLSICAC